MAGRPHSTGDTGRVPTQLLRLSFFDSLAPVVPAFFFAWAFILNRGNEGNLGLASHVGQTSHSLAQEISASAARRPIKPQGFAPKPKPPVSAR